MTSGKGKEKVDPGAPEQQLSRTDRVITYVPGGINRKFLKALKDGIRDSVLKPGESAKALLHVDQGYLLETAPAGVYHFGVEKFGDLKQRGAIGASEKAARAEALNATGVTNDQFTKLLDLVKGKAAQANLIRGYVFQIRNLIISTIPRHGLDSNTQAGGRLNTLDNSLQLAQGRIEELVTAWNSGLGKELEEFDDSDGGAAELNDENKARYVTLKAYEARLDATMRDVAKRVNDGREAIGRLLDTQRGLVVLDTKEFTESDDLPDAISDVIDDKYEDMANGFRATAWVLRKARLGTDKGADAIPEAAAKYTIKGAAAAVGAVIDRAEYEGVRRANWKRAKQLQQAMADDEAVRQHVADFFAAHPDTMHTWATAQGRKALERALDAAEIGVDLMMVPAGVALELTVVGMVVAHFAVPAIVGAGKSAALSAYDLLHELELDATFGSERVSLVEHDVTSVLKRAGDRAIGKLVSGEEKAKIEATVKDQVEAEVQDAVQNELGQVKANKWPAYLEKVSTKVNKALLKATLSSNLTETISDEVGQLTNKVIAKLLDGKTAGMAIEYKYDDVALLGKVTTLLGRGDDPDMAAALQQFLGPDEEGEGSGDTD